MYYDHHQVPSPEVLKIYTDELAETPLTCIGRHDASRWARYHEAVEQLGTFFQGPGDMHFVYSEQDAFARSLQQIYRDEIYPTGKNHVLTLRNESASILTELDRYKELGLHVELLDVDEKGHLTLETLKAAISPRTTLLALSWADALTGVIQPLFEIANFCQENNILLYVQASSVVGKLYFRGDEFPIDYLAIDGRDIGSVEGTGLLFTRAKVVTPESSAGILALSQAVRELDEAMDDRLLESGRLRAEFEKGIAGRATIHFKESDRLPDVSCFSLKGVHADLLLNRLNAKGIAGSLGGERWQKLEHTIGPGAISLRFREGLVAHLLKELQ